MLMCSQLKLSERRSLQKFKRRSSGADSIIARPCLQRNITEVPSKVTNLHLTTEKRNPELRVVSINLESQPNNNSERKIQKSPYRMPLFCEHFKTLQKNYQKDKKELDNDDLLVRGFEVGSGGPVNPSTETNSNPTSTQHDQHDQNDDLAFLKNEIQIQLTDCCQCVCDLFNCNFQIPHEDHDFSYVTIENCNSLRPFRPKDIPPQPPPSTTKTNNILDPNILKVIRVTMNVKS